MSFQDGKTSTEIVAVDSAADFKTPQTDEAAKTETESFEQAVAWYGRRILRLAQRITKNDADAEDVVQDSFMQALVHRDRFQGRSKFSTWLTRIAINESLMKLRRHRRFCEISLDMPVEGGESQIFERIPTEAPSPEQACSNLEQRELVGKMLNSMRREHSDVLRLYFNEDLSYAQIAQTLGITDSAVRSRMHRARCDMRKALTDSMQSRKCFLSTSDSSPQTPEAVKPGSKRAYGRSI